MTIRHATLCALMLLTCSSSCSSPSEEKDGCSLDRYGPWKSVVIDDGYMTVNVPADAEYEANPWIDDGKATMHKYTYRPKSPDMFFVSITTDARHPFKSFYSEFLGEEFEGDVLDEFADDPELASDLLAKVHDLSHIDDYSLCKYLVDPGARFADEKEALLREHLYGLLFARGSVNDNPYGELEFLDRSGQIVAKMVWYAVGVSDSRAISVYGFKNNKYAFDAMILYHSEKPIDAEAAQIVHCVFRRDVMWNRVLRRPETMRKPAD